MASRLNQALDEVIQDRRSERQGSGGGRRYNRGNSNRGGGGRGDFTRRRQVNSDGTIRKRLGPSDTIKSFVRTVNVKNEVRGARNVNSQWANDLFDDDRVSSSPSIISRLGGRGSPKSKTTDISIENLHYDVTENDLVELFSTVADVVKAKLVFDNSGRSTGTASVTYNSIEDAEKAIKKYDNVALDGQAMKIELRKYTPREPRARSGGRFNNNRLDDRGNRGRQGDRGNRDRHPRDDRKRDDRQKSALTAEELDREMDSYMKSNGEDTEMMLD
ncbi:unnamed protein product [Mucor hiemalis]